jgi:transcriptional regulator with XRE-family HTH domain
MTGFLSLVPLRPTGIRYILPFMTPFGDHIRRLRETRGLSQEDLAQRAGVSRSTLSALERGLTKGVDFSTLAMLAVVLGIRPAQLMVDDLTGESPMHDRFSKHNQVIHQWLGATGWFVLRERYDDVGDSLVWDIGRDAGASESGSPTDPRLDKRQVRVRRTVLEDIEPDDIPARFKIAYVANALEHHHSVIVHQNEARNLVCDPFSPE